jgi:small subunit ribosomal protein S1
VRNLTNYGAFVEIEEGIDGLLHVSDMSWTKKVGAPQRGRQEGRPGAVRRAQRRQEKKRIALGMKQLRPTRGSRTSPASSTSATSLGLGHEATNFGVFVELEDDLEGLLHISELSDHKVESPEEVVQGRRRRSRSSVLRVECGRAQDRPE